MELALEVLTELFKFQSRVEEKRNAINQDEPTLISHLAAAVALKPKFFFDIIEHFSCAKV